MKFWLHKVTQSQYLNEMLRKEFLGDPAVLNTVQEIILNFSIFAIRLQRWWLCWKVTVLFAQTCPALCNPTDYSPSGSSVIGILQVRILKFVAIPFCRGSSQLRDLIRVSPFHPSRSSKSTKLNSLCYRAAIFYINMLDSFEFMTFIVNTLLWRVKLHTFPLKGITCICSSWQLTWMNSNCQLCFLGRNVTFTEALGIYIMQEPVRDVGSANTQNLGSSHWTSTPLKSLFPLAVAALKLFTCSVESGLFSR